MIPIIISLISLAVSITVAYNAYLKPPSVKMLAGRTLIIANSYIDDLQTRQPQWGGLSLILPLTFYNWSPVGSSIYRVRLIIGREDDQISNFDMIWTKFIQFSNGGNTLDVESIVHPIPIAGKSSIVKFIQFDWSPYRQQKIPIREGAYKLKIYAWTTINSKPDLKEAIDFNIASEQMLRYQESVDNNEIIPIDISLGENRPPNNVLSRQDIENDYS